VPASRGDRGPVSRLRAAALLLSGLHLLVLAALFGLRIGHPYTLEWQEGAMVDQVARILTGLPLFVAPSLDFVPQIYAPLYFYVSALACRILGVGFLPLRLVSVAASLGCLALIHRFVRRETGSASAGWLAAGLFAGCYAISGAWLDIARVDSLFLFFTLSAIHVLRGDATTRGALFSGALFGLAFLTKQQGLVLALPFVIHEWVARGPRQAAVFAVTLAVGIGGSTLLFQIWTGGWYAFYLFTLPSGHEIFTPMIPGFWIADLLYPLAPACLVAAVCLGMRRPAPAFAAGDRGDPRLFWLLLLGGCVGTSWASRVHSGGHVNVVLPAYAALALAWGVGLHAWTAPAPAGAPGADGRPASAEPRLLDPQPRVRRRAALVWGLCVLQLGWLVHDPRPLLPGEAHRRGGDAFVAALRGIPGEVLAPWHGYLPVLAGKRVHAHRSAVRDVMRSGQEAVAAALADEFRAALASHRFAAVVIDNPYFLQDFMADTLESHYRLAGRLLPEGLEVGPVVGWRENPRLYLPRDDVLPESSRRR